MRWLRPVLVLLLMAAAGIPVRAEAPLELLMVEQAGCVYCQRWHEEIGGQYALTDEGKAAPLRRVDLRAELPASIRLKSRPAFTPTFVLLRGGQETARIEGYPGEHFFWPLLADMIRAARSEAP